MHCFRFPSYNFPMLSLILFAAMLICLLAIVLVAPWAAWRVARIYWSVFSACASRRR